MLGANHPNTLSVLVSLARMNFDARQFADAESMSRDAVRGYEEAKSDVWQRYYAQGLLGASLASTGRYEEAERLLIAGHEGLMRKRSSISVENLGAIDDLRRSIVRLYEEWGKPDRATPWRSSL